jgi:hypothetical protein
MFGQASVCLAVEVRAVKPLQGLRHGYGSHGVALEGKLFSRRLEIVNGAA